MRIHTELSRPKLPRTKSNCGSLRYSFSVCAAALVLTSMVISVESSMATARSGIDATVELVDRTHKGDRLPVRTTISASRPIGSSLPDGCDAAVSPLTRSDLARIAQRCES
jgi:hypothetical protein